MSQHVESVHAFIGLVRVEGIKQDREGWELRMNYSSQGHFHPQRSGAVEVWPLFRSSCGAVMIHLSCLDAESVENGKGGTTV